MSKQKMKDNEQEIIRLREEGQSRQEIANILGLKKEQIKGWVNRYNRRQKKQSMGLRSSICPCISPEAIAASHSFAR